MKKLLIVFILGIILLPKFVSNPYRVDKPQPFQITRIVEWK